MFRRAFLALAVSLSFLPAGMSAALAAEKQVVVFAAASMKGALDDVASLYEARTGTKAVISYAASSALAKQIEAAAPADVFISADLKWMDYLIGKSAVKKEEAVSLLGNRLLLVAGKQSAITLKISAGFDLAGALGADGRLAMGEVKSVPAGKYGKEALEHYGVWKDVEAKVAGAENVRAALALVTRGEAPLGIVYETDAKSEPGVRVVDVFGAESHAPIIYPVAPVAASTNPATRDFIAFLAGADAQAVFTKAGFSILSGS